MQLVAKSVEDVKRKVESVSQAQDELGKRVTKAEADLNGTTHVHQTPDVQQEVQKTEAGSDFNFDTAMPNRKMI